MPTEPEPCCGNCPAFRESTESDLDGHCIAGPPAGESIVYAPDNQPIYIVPRGRWPEVARGELCGKHPRFPWRREEVADARAPE